MSLLQELATEIRAVNAANGWGTSFDPDHNRDELPGYIALIHSEITEAWTAETAQGAIRELGDIVVRCLDLGELIQPGYWAECSQEFTHPWDPREATWANDLMELHGWASQALEQYRKVEDYRPLILHTLHLLTAHTWRLMERYGAGLQPEKVIRAIIANNRTRGYRHGGRRT